MNKTEKAAILKIALFHLSELRRIREPEQYQARQAHRDILAGFQYYGFIQDFNIDKGIFIGSIWHNNGSIK